MSMSVDDHLELASVYGSVIPQAERHDSQLQSYVLVPLHQNCQNEKHPYKHALFNFKREREEQGGKRW